ncbi:MAG: Hpt domain-containing protein [Chloroflexi bacterium]|nr:Hpt domain-containing protein [Chloroflexota bacterium]
MTDPIDAAVFAALVEMTGGEIDFVDELVDTYLEDGRNQLDAMRAAVAAEDDRSLGRAAHSLKSGSLNVGAMGLGELCRALEEAARSGSVPDASERVAAIDAGFDGARRELLAEREHRAPR